MAWSLPGPVQTVYRAELIALLVAVEIFRGDLTVISDCEGVVDEAERIRGGGRPSPTSRHADLWARLDAAIRRDATGSLAIRWVPSHEKEGSGRITPEDRHGNDRADQLAKARAKLVGPTPSQKVTYDSNLAMLAALQETQVAVLTASQEADRS